MKEVKFRAWDTERKVYIHPKDLIGLCGETTKELKEMSPYLELEQFTGILDKNEKEIYFNSDMVNIKFTRVVDSFKECSYIETSEDGSKVYKKIESLPAVLILRNPCKGVEFYNKQYDLYTPLWSKYKDDIDNLEIIGNIHQNNLPSK